MAEKVTWTRRRGEPEEAWRAFQSYREQRSPRRIQYVTVDGMALSPAETARLAKQFDWKARVADYDAHLDEVLLAGKEEALRKGAESASAEHLQILGSLRETLGREAAKLTEKSRNTSVEVLRASDLMKMADSVVKLERLVLGQSTETVASAYDLSRLTTEEKAALHALLTKATPVVTDKE